MGIANVAMVLTKPFDELYDQPGILPETAMVLKQIAGDDEKEQAFRSGIMWNLVKMTVVKAVVWGIPLIPACAGATVQYYVIALGCLQAIQSGWTMFSLCYLGRLFNDIFASVGCILFLLAGIYAAAADPKRETW